MKKRTIGTLLAVLAVAALLAVSAAAQNRDVASNKPLLLFFLNPNGRPCQMQAHILNQNQKEIEKHVTIQGISTTVSSHRQYFYQFGIRQLPALVLIEPTGKVLHRFSPGIHQGSDIISVIGQEGTP